MDLLNKESLLERYWKGETSTAEDTMLKELSSQHPDLFSTEELKYFQGLQNFRELSLPENFAASIIEEDLVAKTPALPNRNLKFFLRIAAAILFCGAITWSVLWTKATPSSRFADVETEEAYIATQKALALISTKMAKVKSVTNALEKFESTQQKIKSSTLK